jgi:ATP-dependent RNA helicase DHX29
MRYYDIIVVNNLYNLDMHYHDIVSLIMQKQNVEKAKASLMNENLDGSASTADNKQSDHLLMVIAYNKWSRILREVIKLISSTRIQFCDIRYICYVLMCT